MSSQHQFFCRFSLPLLFSSPSSASPFFFLPPYIYWATVCEKWKKRESNIPRIITVVVPSPTSSSCVRLSSIMLLAAGWETSISRRIAWPSLVRTIPPMGSSSIFSMALGPRHDRMISATLGWKHRVSWAAQPDGVDRSRSVRLGGSNVGHLSSPSSLPLTTIGVCETMR